MREVKAVFRSLLAALLVSSVLNLVSCDLFAPGLGDVVDISSPELAIVDPPIEPMSYFNSDFTISGTVSDDIGVQEVLVSWPGSRAVAEIQAGQWSVTVPFASITASGAVLFDVAASDQSGKNAAPAYRTITIDKKAPTVLITAPQVYAPGPENSNYILISGELWDESPVTSVQVEIIDPASPSTPVYTELADGDRTWSARIDLDNASVFQSGKAYLYRIVAEDAAGNINTYQYHSADFWTRLSSGETFPSMTDIGYWDQDGGTLDGFTNTDRTDMQISGALPGLTLDFTYNSDRDIPQISLSNLNMDETVAANNSLGQYVPIYASATDDKEGIDRDSVILHITGAGVDLTVDAGEFNDPSGDGLFTTFQFDLSGDNTLEPGEYTGTITVKDKKGTSKTVLFSFMINKGAPKILSLTPSSSYASVDGEGNLIVSLEVSDDNPGTTVTARAYNSEGSEINGVTASLSSALRQEDVDGETAYVADYTAVVPSPVPDFVRLDIIVNDSSNIKSSRTVSYTIDRDIPTAAITVPSDGAAISGSAFTIAGVAEDTGSNVYIVKVLVAPGELDTPPADGLWLNAEGNDTWSLPVDLSASDEGTYTVFAKAYDVADNEGLPVYSKFYFDKDVPELTVDSGTVKAYHNGDYTISGTVSDSNGLSELHGFVSKDGGAFADLPGSPVALSGTAASWSFDMTVNGDGTDDGTYEYQFIVLDIAGKSAEAAKIVIADVTAPEMFVSNLADGESVSTATYKIKGLASDFSGLADKKIEYLLNNTLPWQEKLVASTGNWELDVSGLSEGAGNTIDFRATDILGNSITLDTIHFGLDLNPPSLTIDNKAAFNGTWQRQDFTLNGTTSDANSVQSVQISTDGGATYADVSGFASGDSSWSALVSIPAGGSDDGNHLIKVKAIDGYDKETVDFLSVKYDTSAPTFVVANLADGALVTASPFGVQGSSSDNGGSGVAMMQYSLDNSTWIDISALTTWNADITFPLGLGTSGYFKVIDLVGNESAVSTVTFNTDYQLPETDGNWAGLHYESAPFSLSGTATDDLGVASVSVSGDGVGVLAIDGSAGDLNRNWSVPVTPSGDGTFEYVVRVTDAAGRYREYTRSVSYDTTPPELNVSNLADGDSVETNSYIIRGTATDSSGIQSVEYYNGSAWNAVTGTISWTQEVTGLVEGAGNSIQFRATDNAGHTTTLPAISFGLDLNPPALSIDNKATFDGTWQNSSFTLNGTSTDANGLDTIEISTDGGLTWTEATGFVSGVDAWTADVVIPSDQSEDGTHVIRVKAVDTYNKETIESLTVKYDTAAPTFSLYNLEDDQLITVASYPLLGGWSDNGGSGTVGGNAALQFSTDGGSGWTTVTTMTASAFTHNLVLAEAIDKELQFRAIDYLGNESDILILTGIDIDTALPVVDETTVNTDAQVYRTADLSLSGTASDTQGLSSLIITAAKDGADQGTVYTEASDPGNWGPYTLASGNDGIWTFTITATDIAGRTSSVTREVFMDSTDPSGAITSVPATLTNDGASFLFEGTAGDAGSGIESVKIAFAADGTGAQLAAGKTAWSATVDLVSALGTEGEKTLYVQIEDKAGNLSDWTAVQQGFVYDTALPVVTLNEAINRDVNGSFDLTGSASDNYGIASLSVTQSKDGGADILIDTNGPSGLGSWTLSNLPRDPADIGTTDTTDGTYVYKITSTDLAGKVSTTVLSTIRLDQTAPDVSIVNPGAGQTGLNALSGSAYTFRGSSDDNGGVGMAKIYYLIDQNAAASTTLTDYTALTTTGLWNFTDDFDTDHTGPDTGRAEGTWYIHVLAEDSSGNRTDFASAETVEFDIDQAAPLLTETSSGISGSTTVYRNAVITLGGDVTDGNGIASLVIKYSKNGAPEVELLNETSVVSPWEVIMDAASLGDGSFAITITAVDGVGKSTSLQRNIVIDTTLPDLTVENPVNSELVDSASYTISGKISDNGGVGVTALQYSRDNSTWTDITMTGFSWSVAGIDFSSQVGAETAQGARTLYVRATDGLNGYTSKTISFFYDTEDPVLTETAVATEDELISAASVDFNGQASDTNTLSSLVLSVNGGAAVPLAIDSDGPDDIEGNGDDNSWSYTHSNLMDGEFALVFTATDGAGRTTIVERNLLIDNTAPTTPVISSSPGAYVSYSLSVTGTAGDATSGILSVQYSVDNETTWHNLSGTTNWFGSIDVSALSIGGKTVYIRSIDRAGKISASATQAYIIDRANPGVTLNESVNRDVNGGFSLTGTSSDDYGIDTVVITQSKDGGADIPIDTNGPSGTSVWSLADLPRNPADIGTQVTFDGTFDGSYVYKITSMDSVGKSSTEILSTIRLDMTAPETLTVSNPGAGQIGVNSLSGDIFTFSGSSSDAGVGVEKIYYLIDQNAAASTTIGDYTPLLTSGYWSFSDDFDIDGGGVDTGRAEGKWYIHVLAEDSSGNRTPFASAETVEFDIDQAVPVIIEDGLIGTNITTNSNVVLEITINETNGLVHGDLLDGGPVEDVVYFEMMINGSDWAADSSRTEYTGVDMTLDITSELSDGNNEVLIRATDLVGKISTVVKRDIFFDDDPPVVSFINLNGSSVVNGESYIIQGTVSDALSTISSVVIDIDGPGTLADLNDQIVTGTYSWSYNLDLTPSGYYADGPISITVTAVDSAGNSVDESLSFAIDQEEDMPSLSLSGISVFSQLSTAYVSADDYILAGVLLDSDGVDIDSIVLTFDGVPTPVRVINGADEDSSITWYADLSAKAGATYTYSVSAVDTNTAAVESNFSGMVATDIPLLGTGAKISGTAEDDDAFDASSLLLLQNGTDVSGSVVAGSNSTYVPWSYALPVSDDLYYFELNGADATSAAIPVDWSKYSGQTLKTMVLKDSGSPVITVNSPAQGSYVSGNVTTDGEAYDNLAINSLTITAVQSDNVTSVELTSDPGVGLITTEGTGEYYYDSVAGKYVWDFALERLPDAYENDSITLVYEATDIAGNSTVKERSVTIDTVDPAINIQYPSDGALVTGEVTIQGTTTDERIASVEMKRGLTGSWETLSGTYNWNYTFNSVTSAVTDDATDNGDGTYNYPVEIRATDAAGNQTTISSYSFNISPDLDKPVVSVTTPSDNSTLGGAILIIGTATDNEAVDAVYARIDINGDGDYVDSFDLDGANGTNDPFEREGTWYEISDFQSGVWKLQINSTGELYRSKAWNTVSAENYIHIQFMAEDIEGAQSIELTRTITLDETFPDISNFGLNGGGTDISGNINLLADLTDNDGITAVDISYNGGLSYESVYSGNTLSYSLDINKDSEATVGAGGLGLADNSAIVKVRLKVTDTTGYQSFSNLELSVDNIAPTGAYTGKVDDIGSAGGVYDAGNSITISGTAKDTGVVSSFGRVEVYIAQEGNIITPLTGAVSTSTTRDFGDGNGDVIYPLDSNASDFIVIDDTTEQGLIDNDGDGFIEDISYASGETSWATWFNTSYIDNNQAVEVHYVIYDKAGNASHYVEIMLIVGSDLDNDGTVEPSEQIAYPQAFQARRGLLYFELFGGTKTGFNLEIDDNLGNPTIFTSAPTTAVIIDTSSSVNYPEGDAVFTIRLYEGADLKLTKNISVEIKGADTAPPVLTMTALTQSSVVDGHLDQGDNGNGADYDISGTVKFQGTVTDDTMVQDIVLNIEGETPLILAEWDSGLFTAKNGGVITNQSLDWKEGHSVSFSYEWDSATITNIAELDLDVTFEARDYSNPTVSDVETYDIVPYIESITRTGFNTNRSKLGFYPLRRGETGVQINGYNLRAGGTGDSVMIGATSTSNSSASGEITTNVPAAAASGYLTVTVNSVTAINNLNSNSSTYNKESNPYVEGTSLWTDDRYIHIWQSDDNQTGSNRGYFTGSQDPIHPAMTMDGSGVLYASWSNYSLADVLVNSNDNDTTTRIFSSYDPAEHTDISYGTQLSVVYNANTYGNSSWDANGAGGVEVWRSGRTYYMEELYHDEMLMQFINQRVKTVGNISHISYYDTDTKSIKYDRKDLTSFQTAEQTSWINIDGYYDADDGTRVVGGTGSRNVNMKAGEYNAIDVTPSTLYPVIAYYDVANQKLKIAYSNSTNPSAANWTTQDVTANSSYSGKYVSMRIDSSGYVHLAYYKTSTGDLCYIKSTNNPTDGNTAYSFGPEVTVDSIGSVGMWADLSLNGASPVISYLDVSKVNSFDGLKIATIESSFDTNYDGSVDASDEVWETQNIPLAYEVDSKRTSIEFDTGNDNLWEKAIGYASSDYYRITYYIPE